MKKKLPSICLFFVLLLGSGTIAHAEEEDAPVEPNIYEEKEIKINTDYFHEQPELKRKEELPEAQKSLTFEPPEKTESEKIEQQLFQSSVIETNTITTKSDQLGLFSSNNEQTGVKTRDEQQDTQGSSNVMFLLLGVVVLIIVAMFILILPKFKQSNIA